METLFKTFAAEIKALPDARTIKFLISTNSIDRDGDILEPKGWQIDTYKKNPVVLWSHDYTSLPIAKAVSIEPTDKGLAATAEFPAKGVHPFADTVYELLKGGFLGAASVGFKPITQEKAVDRDKGFNYLEQELLEFSVVPIPANPEALVQMSMTNPKYKGLLKPLVAWSEKLLEEYYGERGVYLPAAQIEKVFEMINKSQLLKDDRQTHGGVVKPLPVPHADETDSQFVSRCMGDAHMNEKFPDEKQRAAVCYAQAGKFYSGGINHDDVCIEFEEELVTIDVEQVKAEIQAITKQALHTAIEQAAMRAVEYATGRVS